MADPVEAILVSRQSTVRATYMRSIGELSASPSFADQVVAQSLRKFVSEMPAPQPNSTRARVAAPPQQEVDISLTTISAGPSDTDRDADPIAAALARSRAMREKLEAKRALQSGPDRAGSAPDAPRASGVTDRLRSLMEEAEKQSSTPTPNKPEEVVREIMDRDRAARDRERSPDRGGPRR